MSDREAEIRAMLDNGGMPSPPLVRALLKQLDALREREAAKDKTLRGIERMAGAAGYGETPAKPLAEIARAALAPTEEQT